MAALIRKIVPLALLTVCPILFGECRKSEKVKEYILNLDLREEDRWTDIVKAHNFINQKEADKIISSLIPKEYQPLLEKLGESIDLYLPSPFSGEIRGISKAANVSLGVMVALNLMYEATAYCTSIVAQDDEKHIWHGRNLDYGARVANFSELLRKQTVTVHMQRNKTTVVTTTTYVGYTGIVTGMKPHSFTLSLNERNQGAWWMNLLMAIFDRKALPDGFLVRKTLENATSYSDAVKMLQYTDTIADAYFIVGGIKPGEGVVITKDHIGAADVWTLDPSSNRWYVLETNYDHWKAPPATDNRREPAMKAMNATGNTGFNITSLYKVLSIPPVLNVHTTYTTGMSAAIPDLYMSWIRYP